VSERKGRILWCVCLLLGSALVDVWQRGSHASVRVSVCKVRWSPVSDIGHQRAETEAHPHRGCHDDRPAAATQRPTTCWQTGVWVHTDTYYYYYYTHTHPHTHSTALFPGLPGWAGTRKVKPIWISLKQETVSGSAISWVICQSAPRSRQITTPAPHHSVFYRPDALPTAQPTASKHWRFKFDNKVLMVALPVDKGWNAKKEQKCWKKIEEKFS